MEQKKEPLTNIHKIFIKQMNQVVQNKRLALQTEENGNKIARLQGYCGGFYTYKRLLKEAGYDETGMPAETEFTEPFINAEGCKLTFPELRSVCEQTLVLKFLDSYFELKRLIMVAIDEQKERLFFESEKGRDLFWSKGWYESVIQIDRWIEELDYYLENQKKEKEEMLPFEYEE